VVFLIWYTRILIVFGFKKSLMLLIHSFSKFFFTYAATATNQSLICVPWLILSKSSRIFYLNIKKFAEITGSKYFT
jgi:hypothetical protein